MNKPEKSLLQRTTDPQDYTVCAGMMCKTDPWITLGMNFEQCLKAFEGLGKEIYILQLDQKMAGFVILQMVGSFKGYIQTLCIDADQRGQGLGNSILQFCQERILKISPNIFICVSSFNHGAIRLYEKFGFEPVGRLENFIKNGFTEILLRKTIGPVLEYHLGSTS